MTGDPQEAMGIEKAGEEELLCSSLIGAGIS